MLVLVSYVCRGTSTLLEGVGVGWGRGGFTSNIAFNYVTKLASNIFTRIVNWFEYAEFNGDVEFSCFRLELSLLGKFGPKIQNCLFKVNLDTQTNSNMPNSMVIFTFFCFFLKWPFLSKFGPKHQKLSV